MKATYSTTRVCIVCVLLVLSSTSGQNSLVIVPFRVGINLGLREYYVNATHIND